MSTYTNLVFKGGGVKGIAYAGALFQLNQMGILTQIKRVAGTSAGAITATLLALGYTASEIEDIVVNQMDFASFMDKGWLPGNVNRFLKGFGWYKGDAFKQWLGERVKAKTGSVLTNFNDLKAMVDEQSGQFRELYVIATNLNRQYPELFSVEDNASTTIVDAVRMSMSIPLFFQSVTWNSNVMVDGGMAYNYPIDLFDKKQYAEKNESMITVEQGSSPIDVNLETLGLWLDTKAGIDNLRNRKPKPPKEIKNIKEYSASLVDYMMEMANMAHLETYDWKRSILIDTLDVKTTDFEKAKQKAPELVASGKQGVIDYFKTVNPQP
jgi:NTE family protein